MATNRFVGRSSKSVRQTRTRVAEQLSASSTVDPKDKGRILYVDDIQEIYGAAANGAPRKSAWWVTHRFAPEFKRKAGRDVYWFEREAYAWIDAQRVVA